MLVTRQPRDRARWCAIGKDCKSQDYDAVRRSSAPWRDYWEPAADPDGNVRDRMTEPERLLWRENVAEELAFVRELPTGRMVDCGCGPGWFLREFPDWWRMGVEVSIDACAELDRHKLPHAENCHGIAPDSVDLVVCLHVIEHLGDPIQVLCDMHRMLRRGGWLILGTPDFDSPCARRFGPNYRMLHDATHCSLFTRESLHRMLRDFSFDIRDVRYPFPDRFATAETWDRWHDTSKVSPPWPGNWMTFYCAK